MADMKQAQTESVLPSGPDGGAPQGVELRHLRYFVAVADAGTFTHAAERMYIAQPTLSQQIRRLEEMVGTPLLQRRREGVRLTEAGTVLLEESRTVLSLIDHGVSRTRQAAGLGRPAPALCGAAASARDPGRRNGLAAALHGRRRWGGRRWLETPLDAEFSPIRQRRADAGLGWLSPAGEELPAPLEVMSLGEFEPDVWIPAVHPAAPAAAVRPGRAGPHGRRPRAPPGRARATYDAWLAVLRDEDPRFEFADPPFRTSLPMTLAFAATGSRPTAVLTGPRTASGVRPGAARPVRRRHLRHGSRARSSVPSGRHGRPGLEW